MENKENKIISTEEEINLLKAQISELESNSGDKGEPEIIKEVLRLHAEKSPQEVLAESHKFSEEEIKSRAQSVAELREEGEDPYQKQIMELLQIAHDGGVLNAVSLAKKLEDPHLEDAFHDALVKYFQGIKKI